MRSAAILLTCIPLFYGGCNATSCLCASPVLTIRIPPAIVSGARVHVSGSACGDRDLTADAFCADPVDASGCTAFLLQPDQTGACHVDIALADGSHFIRDVQFSTGMATCCGSAFTAIVASPSEIDVTLAIVDGGTAG